MDLRPAVLAAAFLIGSAAGAMAAEGGLAARTLSGYCNSAYDVDAGFCAGYVTALAEIMLDQPLYGFHACGHAPVRSQQLMEIAAENLRQEEDGTTGSARLKVAGTLARSFPCR